MSAQEEPWNILNPAKPSEDEQWLFSQVTQSCPRSNNVQQICPRFTMVCVSNGFTTIIQILWLTWYNHYEFYNHNVLIDPIPPPAWSSFPELPFPRLAMTSLSPPLSSTLLLLRGPLPVLRPPGHTCPSRHERKPPADCCHCNVLFKSPNSHCLIILDNLKSTGKVDFLFKEIKGPPIARILQYLICIELNQHIHIRTHYACTILCDII